MMTRTDFIEFLKEFKANFDQDQENWENNNLSDFLEAMIAYTVDIQTYYNNVGLEVDADIASWEVFSTILRGASVYE